MFPKWLQNNYLNYYVSKILKGILHLTISGFKNIVSNKGFAKNSINTAIITLFNLDFDSKDAHILNELRNKSSDIIRSLDKTDMNTIFLHFYVDNKTNYVER